MPDLLKPSLPIVYNTGQPLPPVPAENATASACTYKESKLLDQLREALRSRHHSLIMESTHVHWLIDMSVFKLSGHLNETVGPSYT